MSIFAFIGYFATTIHAPLKAAVCILHSILTTLSLFTRLVFRSGLWSVYNVVSICIHKAKKNSYIFKNINLLINQTFSLKCKMPSNHKMSKHFLPFLQINLHPTNHCVRPSIRRSLALMKCLPSLAQFGYYLHQSSLESLN